MCGCQKNGGGTAAAPPLVQGAQAAAAPPRLWQVGGFTYTEYSEALAVSTATGLPIEVVA